MITAKTMRRIAPKQGDATTEHILNYTAQVLERDGLTVTLMYLELCTKTEKGKKRRKVYAQLLEVMRSPEIIDEWTPVGGDIDE